MPNDPNEDRLIRIENYIIDNNAKTVLVLDKVETLIKDKKDHEQRLSTLEKDKSMVLGIVTFISGIITIFANYLINIFTRA